jgi:hypothetical protein
VAVAVVVDEVVARLGGTIGSGAQRIRLITSVGCIRSTALPIESVAIAGVGPPLVHAALVGAAVLSCALASVTRWLRGLVFTASLDPGIVLVSGGVFSVLNRGGLVSILHPLGELLDGT